MELLVLRFSSLLVIAVAIAVGCTGGESAMLSYSTSGGIPPLDNSSAEPLPNWVQYVGLGLAAFSAVMAGLAAPTLLQVFFGGPKLHTEFKDDDPGGGQRDLIVFLHNRPSAKLLGRLAVVKRDTIQSLTATVQICQEKTGALVVPVRQMPISSDAADDGHDRISLPPTYSVGAFIKVVTWNPAGGQAEIPPTLARGPVPLMPGIYEARIILTVDGTPEYEVKRFSVARTAAELNWQ